MRLTQYDSYQTNDYFRGRLNFNTRNYGWTSYGVCGDSVTTETANVVCNIICGTNDGRFYGSILRASKYYSDYYPTNFYYATQMRCRGPEKAIQDCPYSQEYYPNCRTKEKIGINCFREQDTSKSQRMQSQMHINSYL